MAALALIAAVRHRLSPRHQVVARSVPAEVEAVEANEEPRRHRPITLAVEATAAVATGTVAVDAVARL